jgi:CubicO group peptidase (beta-lactamase class C family)
MGVKAPTGRRSHAASALAVCALAVVSACASPAPRSSGAPYAIDLGVAISDPEPLGWSPDRLAALQQDLDALGSAAVLIVTGDQVVFSHGDVARTYRAHSIRKSLLSALYGIAIGDGRIDPGQTLAELGIDDTTPLTASEQRATVAGLLAARSGVYLPAASEEASMRGGRPERLAHEPGTHWYYNNWDFNVLGSIYRQETGEDIFEAFERRIAVPLGMDDYDLGDTRYQYEEVSSHPSYKFRMSARDLARFGLLYLDRGAWGGEQIIPASWIETSTRAHSLTGKRGTKSGFGLMWWVVADLEGQPAAALLSGAFTASGTGGQRLTVLPAIDTVVVHRVDTDDPDAPRIGSSDYDRFLTAVVRARLSAGARP